jgi:3'-phosphoadenosine 5'-phosphosulfate sulfotransferase (PAPS reductase)/FAD synthetase
VADPYLIQGPALISDSGGRSSARMLHGIIQAHGGVLPDDVVVAFCNTGKEREQTLEFVRDQEDHWGVKIHWLEFVSGLRSVGAAGRFKGVTFETASRNGEPFDRLIAWKTGALPNGRARFCTEFLKVKVLFDFAEAMGLGVPGQYTEVIGLRADEKFRIERLRQDARNGASQLSFPLSSAGIRKSDIFSFWQAQNFDLRLERGLGNCDHCPMIGDRDRVARAQRDPAGCEWWARHEMARGYRFGRHFTFVELLGLAGSSPNLPLGEDYESECGTWCSGMTA